VNNFSPELITSTVAEAPTSERWRVILYNDRRHHFDDIVFWLESMTECDTDFAYKICHVCEDQGRAVCYQDCKSACHDVATTLRSKGLQVEVDDY
jgi:ATP-dependent Clp protease adapter protein ClpS